MTPLRGRETELARLGELADSLRAGAAGHAGRAGEDRLLEAAAREDLGRMLAARSAAGEAAAQLEAAYLRGRNTYCNGT